MDTPLGWDEVDDALTRALDVEAEERAHYLATLTPPLRAAVEELLTVALAEHPVLDHPDAVLQPLLHAPATPDIDEDTRVGPYRIEALIGEGGMGRVYRARRDDGTFTKTVALKVVRHSLALAGSNVAARLRRERDLLAALDHPGIARLLDGGETPDGVPYLVTEFIDGLPITAWADAHNASIQQRIQLLMDVAEAVDHAHRRFVIHRDLKPSNVLVTEQDGTPRVAVLDFGIAKLLEVADEAGSRAFPLTQTGLRMLTPAYAAPELFDPATVPSTAVDVYGLGALLYEVLTGMRSYETAPAGVAPVGEPTRPSQAVITLAAEREVAYDASRRARALQGDLDTICLKALHPDPARRYVSAGALAEDLQRYLEGRPIAARPDSALYVLSRFARRNRAAVVAATFAVLALVLGLTVSLVALSHERQARQDAVLAAQRASGAAQLVRDFFSQPLVNEREVTVRDMMEFGLEQAPDDSTTLEWHAYLRSAIAEGFLKLRDFERADSLYAVALDLFATSKDPAGETYALARIGYAYTRMLLGDAETAIPLYEQAFRDVGEDQQTSDIAYRALLMVPHAYADLRRYDEAVEAAERLIRLVEADTDTLKVIDVQGVYAQVLYGARRVEEAIEVSESLREYLLDSLGPLHLNTVHSACVLGTIFAHEQIRLSEGKQLLETCIADRPDMFAEDDPWVVSALYRLGLVHMELQQYAEAQALFETARTRSWSANNAFDEALALHGIALIANTQRQFAQAEAAVREAIQNNPAVLHDTTWVALQLAAQLGLALHAQQNDQAALPYLQAYVTQYQAGMGQGETTLEASFAQQAHRAAQSALDEVGLRATDGLK